MHFALQEAAAGRQSVFICQREKIEKSPPVLPDGIDVSSDLLDQIHMKSSDICLPLFDREDRADTCQLLKSCWTV